MNSPSGIRRRAISRSARTGEMNDTIRRIIGEHGRLPVDVQTLDDHADLYQAGMTSHASVNVMLGLEEAVMTWVPSILAMWNPRSISSSVMSFLKL